MNVTKIMCGFGLRNSYRLSNFLNINYLVAANYLPLEPAITVYFKWEPGAIFAPNKSLSEIYQFARSADQDAFIVCQLFVLVDKLIPELLAVLMA
jgi:hypothetical protein